MSSAKVIVPCGRCHTRNLVPVGRTDEKPLCGKCHSPLDMSNAFPREPVTLTDFSFVPQVLEFPGPAAVVFWTPRCGHCRTFEPVFNHTAQAFNGRIKFARLNIDDHPVGASQYHIQGTPTVILFKNGIEVDRTVGAVPVEVFEEKVNKLV